MMRAIVSAGGTGGHIYPALAIIHKIKEKEPNLSLIHISEPTRHSLISYAVFCLKKFFLMIRRPPRSTHCISSAASDVYKRQYEDVARAARQHGRPFEEVARAAVAAFFRKER